MKKDSHLLTELISGMIKGISFLSSLGIVHGDIKPDNILIDFDGYEFHSIKIIDFGSSFLHEKGVTPAFTMNTPEYLAPEVLRHL